MKLRGLGLLLAVSLLVPPALHAEIYTVFSDNGFPPSTASPSVDTFKGDAAGELNGTASDINPPEGYTSFKTQNGTTFAGWAFDYGSAQDLSRFNGGELRFWIYATNPNIEIDIKNNVDLGQACDGNNCIISQNLQSAPYNLGNTLNQWVLMRIPLTGLLHPLTATEFPFVATGLSGSSTFYIDDVRYVTSDVASPSFSVALKNRSDNSTVSQITWSNATAVSSWALADQYIEVAMDANTPSWGVQIYTDNTNGSGNSQYTGVVNSTTPVGGLVNTARQTDVIPLAWEILAVTSPTLVAQEPNNCPGNGLACLWFYMQDHATFNRGNANVYDGAPYVSAVSNYGIHYAQGTVFHDPNEFGAANPPSIIYLEGNFKSALGNSTYKTSILRVEAFSE